ncbi:hypothetical protein LTR94_028381, partial [Friedmanniomyces endolithicus]
MDAIERFAADVSHEIKNPLTSIRSALETLPLVKTDEQRARLTNLLQQDVRRLDRLITDISNASRLDAELSRDRPRAIDLKELLGDIIGVYEAGQKPGEPPVRFVLSADSARVVGRDIPLGQVFRNLIDNARSFSPAGGSVRVLLEEIEGDLGVRIRVEDQGPGLPPDNLETVFERFYTSRPKGTAFGGNSGLGLSIVRQIVEAHGGRVWAENMSGPDGAVLGARRAAHVNNPDLKAPLHATTVAIRQGGEWKAVMILGPSGAGKSDLALRLIGRGWRLVSDDYTQVWISGQALYATAPEVIRGKIEARG